MRLLPATLVSVAVLAIVVCTLPADAAAGKLAIESVYSMLA